VLCWDGWDWDCWDGTALLTTGLELVATFEACGACVADDSSSGWFADVPVLAVATVELPGISNSSEGYTPRWVLLVCCNEFQVWRRAKQDIAQEN